VGDRKSLSRHGERITESCLNVFTEERLRYHSSVNRLRLLFVDILNSAWKTSFLWGVHFFVQGHLNLLPLERAQLPPDGARAARRSAHASWKPSSGASKLGPDPVESIAGGGPHHAGLYQWQSRRAARAIDTARDGAHVPNARPTCQNTTREQSRWPGDSCTLG
jgi:hypothetical protein